MARGAPHPSGAPRRRGVARFESPCPRIGPVGLKSHRQARRTRSPPWGAMTTRGKLGLLHQNAVHEHELRRPATGRRHARPPDRDPQPRIRSERGVGSPISMPRGGTSDRETRSGLAGSHKKPIYSPYDAYERPRRRAERSLVCHYRLTRARPSRRGGFIFNRDNACKSRPFGRAGAARSRRTD